MIYITQAAASLSSSTRRFSTHTTCEGKLGAGVATLSTLSLVLLMLNLWRVPIIILITITGSPSSALSIAAVSLATNPNYEGNISKLDFHHNQHLQQQTNKLSLNTNDVKNGSTIGLISLSFGGLVLTNDYHEPQSNLTVKKAAVLRRSGGETRIVSNQDVTTLALAMENSSSVAIANINSNGNNVIVTIGAPGTNQFQYHQNPTANLTLK